jgi:peptidoglycan/LPS O-acetylase OafA/YrhL
MIESKSPASANSTHEPEDLKGFDRATSEDRGIETLRGFATLLVVLFHADYLTSEGGLPIVRFFNDLMEPIRMPLFAAIAGFVYGIRPLERGNTASFVLGKARRLLLPITSFGLMTYVLKMSPPFLESPSGLVEVWRVLVFPNSHFWFPVALFIIMLVIACLEQQLWLDRPSVFGGLILLGTLLFIPLQHVHDLFHSMPFAVGGALYLFPFFLLGLSLFRFPGIYQQVHVKLFVVLSFVVATGLLILSLSHILSTPYCRTSLWAIVVGASAIILAVQYRRTERSLAGIGTFSYAIYLFHPFIIVFVDAHLPLTHSSRTIIVVLISVVTSVIASVIGHLMLVRFRILRILFLGLR